MDYVIMELNIHEEYAKKQFGIIRNSNIQRF